MGYQTCNRAAFERVRAVPQPMPYATAERRTCSARAGCLSHALATRAMAPEGSRAKAPFRAAGRCLYSELNARSYDELLKQ